MAGRLDSRPSALNIGRSALAAAPERAVVTSPPVSQARSTAMRRLLVLALFGCASGGGAAGSSGSTASGSSVADRVVLVDERGRVYRSAGTSPDAAEQEVPATPQEAVQALVGTYESLGINVNTLDWTAGRVAATNFAAPRRLGGRPMDTYVDCGITSVGQPRANSYAVTLNVESVVRPGTTAGKVTLATRAVGTARPQSVSGDPIACTTTGQLEKLVNLRAGARIAGSAP